MPRSPLLRPNARQPLPASATPRSTPRSPLLRLNARQRSPASATPRSMPRSPLLRPSARRRSDHTFGSTASPAERPLPEQSRHGSASARREVPETDGRAEQTEQPGARCGVATDSRRQPHCASHHDFGYFARLGGVPISHMACACPRWGEAARAPLSRNQVELMEVDTVASAGMPGFDDLGIAPQPLEHALDQISQGARGIVRRASPLRSLSMPDTLVVGGRSSKRRMWCWSTIRKDFSGTELVRK